MTDIVHMHGRPEFDTRAIKAGAVQYVVCATCGAGAGASCVFLPSGKPIPDFAHIARRFEYVEGRGVIYDEPSVVPPEIWRQCQQGRHKDCKPHPPGCCKYPPDPCECSCHNVEDILGAEPQSDADTAFNGAPVDWSMKDILG